MSNENGKGDEDARKLFLGGLPPAATKDDLQEHFGKFGLVQMCTIKTDVYTGRSRGFGFLIFQDVDSVTQVLNETHTICEKTIEAKLATPQKGYEVEKNTKVFVGGLDKSSTKEDITSAFSVHGVVTDVYLPIDKESNTPKGFAFVNFDSHTTAEEMCKKATVTISGKECDVKRANNKNESRGGGRGGFRGGRGGFQGRGGGGYNNYEYGGGGGYGGGYDQYSGGYQGGYQTGYGGQNYGGYDQYGGGYDQSAGYGGGYGGYDQSGGYGGGQDQYKMKGGRGRGGGGYTPY